MKQRFFFIFGVLKQLWLYIFMLLAFVLKCQDKLYFLDGTTKKGKVTEIAPEFISLKVDTGLLEFPRSSILLIEFLDGTFEKISLAEKDVIAAADKKENFHFKQAEKEVFTYNFASVNSLAICNSDLSAFYERIMPTKTIGLGVMGAYNFNQYVNATNAFIAVLANAKKRYDVGAFINFYPGHFEKRNYGYFGMLVKYTAFNFTSVTEDSSLVGNTITHITTFKPAQGTQLATIFTTGSHSDITKTFFIRTIFGLGAFKLKGEYKKQFNLELNKVNTTGEKLDYTLLPKFYFGFNIGFKL